MIITEEELEDRKSSVLGQMWDELCEHETLTEKFIENHKDEVDWSTISYCQKLSEPFIEKHKDDVDWTGISSHAKLSEAFIEKFANRFNWPCLCGNQPLTESFIDKFADKVDWYELYNESQKFSEDFLRRHSDKINWGKVAQYQNFSYDFFNDFRDNFKQYIVMIVARNGVIDSAVAEKILLEYWDKDKELLAKDWKSHFYHYSVWEAISLHPLSEYALEIVKDRVNWNIIYHNLVMNGSDRLSEKFLLKHKKRIDFSLPYIKNALEKRKEKGFSI